MNTEPADILMNCSNTFKIKSQEYGDGYVFFGKLVKGMFPEGITLTTEKDFTRWGIFHHMMSKMHRYAQNFQKGGHEDSLIDLSIYSAMLCTLDKKEDA